MTDYESRLRDEIAARATAEDIDSILKENIANYVAGKKIHNRASARWEYANRVMAVRAQERKECGLD